MNLLDWMIREGWVTKRGNPDYGRLARELDLTRPGAQKIVLGGEPRPANARKIKTLTGDEVDFVDLYKVSRRRGSNLDKGAHGGKRLRFVPERVGKNVSGGFRR